MASETFKKRQKEIARREKQKKKFERRMERKAEKTKSENPVEGGSPKITPVDFQRGPTIL
jgi:hypothetical protein